MDVQMTDAVPVPAAAAAAIPSSQHTLDNEIAEILKPGKTLMPLQREAVEWMVNNPRCMFSDDMGLGKTLAALVTVGVTALRGGRNNPFMCLICVRNNEHVRNWQRDINAFIREKFFTVIVMNSDTEELPRHSGRYLIFCTYARMRNSFAKALDLLPDGVISPPSKKRGNYASRLASISVISNEEQDDEQDDEEGLGLTDAILGTVGYHQEEEEEEEAPAAASKSRKRQLSVNGARFASHSMSTLASRRKIFDSDPAHWTDKRVDSRTALPCAPLLKPNADHPSIYCRTWNGIVFDEAHELKAIGAAQTKAALFLHYTKLMLWQSGTPIQNKLREINSGLLMIRESKFSGETEQIMDPDGIPYKGVALQEARALRAIPMVMFRRSTEDLVRTKPEVLAQDSRTAFLLTTKVNRGVLAENWANPEEKKLHDNYVRKLKSLAERLLVKKTNSLAAKKGLKRKIDDDDDRETEEEEKDGKESLLTAYTRALQVCAAATVINNSNNNHDAIEHIDAFDTKSTKMQMLRKVVKNQIPAGEKIIVFDHRVEVLRVAARMLASNGLPAVMMASEFSDKQRSTGLERWKSENSGVNILLAQTTMCGTGHTWTEARYVIHMTPNFNPAIEDQANARAWRVGQTSDVVVFILVIAGSIEELVLEMQARKKRENKRVLSSAEVATAGAKSSKQPKLNPEEVIRHAAMILDPVAAGPFHEANAYRARNEFEEKSNLDRVRSLFKGPNWVTEKMLTDGDIYFLDPRRSYSDAGFLPRGSMVFTVQSASHQRANELSYSAERSRQRMDPLTPAITKSAKKQKPATLLADITGIRPSTTPAGMDLPRNMRIALCPVSLFVLFENEFYGELTRLAIIYNDRRNAHVKVMGGRPTNIATPLQPVSNGLFRASNPPAASPLSNVMNADQRGTAYQSMAQSLGNRAAKPGGGLSGPGYNLEMLNTPAEIAGALKEYFQPVFGILHPVDNPLQRARHISDTYHYRTQPNGAIELRGSTAAVLTDPRCSAVAPIFRTFQLGVDILMSFAPLWHMPGFGLSERLRTLSVPPSDATDLYASPNEELRRKVHWMFVPQLGADPLPKESMIAGKSEFPAHAIRYILAPLLTEAATAMCSTHVRAMATAVLTAFSLSGSDACKVYLFACGDLQLQGAGCIQSVLVAVRVNGDTLIGAGIYQRSPLDTVYRDTLTGTVWKRIREDKSIKTLINVQRQLMAGDNNNGWQETPRTNPVYYPNSTTLNWGAYADGYSCYTRKQQ